MPKFVEKSFADGLIYILLFKVGESCMLSIMSIHSQCTIYAQIFANLISLAKIKFCPVLKIE